MLLHIRNMLREKSTRKPDIIVFGLVFIFEDQLSTKMSFLTNYLTDQSKIDIQLSIIHLVSKKIFKKTSRSLLRHWQISCFVYGTENPPVFFTVCPQYATGSERADLQWGVINPLCFCQYKLFMCGSLFMYLMALSIVEISLQLNIYFVQFLFQTTLQ